MAVVECNVPPAAAEWDRLWTSFIRAEVAGDEKRARELVADMIAYHAKYDFPCPAWLEGYGET
jgi:hypothetical protein